MRIPPEAYINLFIPPELGLQQAYLVPQCQVYQDSGIQKGVVSRFGVATDYSFIQFQQQQGSLAREQKHLFLQSQDCNKKDI